MDIGIADDGAIIPFRSLTACQFEVPGNPKPQARLGRSASGNIYDPCKPQKREFQAIARQEVSFNDDTPRPLYQNMYLRMTVNFRMQRPLSHFVGRNRDSMELTDTAPLFVTTRVDIDNLLKFVMDALDKEFYPDDSKIAIVVADKLYDSVGRCEGRTVVRIEEIVIPTN